MNCDRYYRESKLGQIGSDIDIGDTYTCTPTPIDDAHERREVPTSLEKFLARDKRVFSIVRTADGYGRFFRYILWQTSARTAKLSLIKRCMGSTRTPDSKRLEHNVRNAKPILDAYV